MPEIPPVLSPIEDEFMKVPRNFPGGNWGLGPGSKLNLCTSRVQSYFKMLNLLCCVRGEKKSYVVAKLR